MRSPMWILNIGLVVLLLVTFVLIGLIRQRPPSRRQLTFPPIQVARKKEISPVDVRLIYENDLFRTYIKPTPIAPKPEMVPAITIPQPPRARPVAHVELPHLTFLQPLKIQLKGIIFNTNEADNRVIISDESTKQEKLYSVGDMIEDAEIIRIENNQVIFMRSNGQQETIFLSASAAKKDPIYSNNITEWDGIVKKVGDNTFIIDPQKLIAQLTSLASLIDMLDITTAIDQTGNVVGVHIGAMMPQSLGLAMGLREGDIVTQINGMSTGTTDNRVDLYRAISNLTIGATIKIDIIRSSRPMVVNVLLQVIEAPLSKKEEKEVSDMPLRIEDVDAQLQKMPPEPHFMDQVKKHDKVAMKQFGGKESILERRPVR